METPLRKLKRLWTRSPKENVGELVARLRPASAQKTAAPWLTGKHANWNRLPHYLELLRGFTARAGHPLVFADKRVLEVGPGPALGFAPFALVEGAAQVTELEPGFRDCRADPTFRDEYLFPLYSAHARLHQPRGDFDFDRFVERVNEIEVMTSNLETWASTAPPYDVVVSKSCLEEIADLAAAVSVLHRVSAAGAVHAHYVDFSLYFEQHRVGSPFGSTYRMARRQHPEHLSRPGGVINLLRPSEMVAVFEKHFEVVRFFPLEDHRGRMSLAGRHSDWAGFAEDDLAVANGVIVAVRGGP